MPRHSGHKRRAQSPASDDFRAECPYTLQVLSLTGKKRGGGSGSSKQKSKNNAKKRRKTDDGSGGMMEEPDPVPTTAHQPSLYVPKGAFVTRNSMAVNYVVEPAQLWMNLTRYSSFVLNDTKYECESFIYVANESSLENQRTVEAAARAAAWAGDVAPVAAPVKHFHADWVARILEIRASDEHHVYARVSWMYWPDELPANTHCGNKVVQGRQPYHGASELIASNHMDIINVVSVTSKATVNHLNEDKDDDVQSALYWRQALDVVTLELSSLESVCDCDVPANPDKMLVGCGNAACGIWIHEGCLKHYALMRTVERLGRNTPHVSKHIRPRDSRYGGNEDEEGDGADAGDERKNSKIKQPPSPSEPGGGALTELSIKVKTEQIYQGLEMADSNDDSKSTDKATAASTQKRRGSSRKGNDQAALRKKKRQSSKAYSSDYEDDDDSDDRDNNVDDDTYRDKPSHTLPTPHADVGREKDPGGLATPRPSAAAKGRSRLGGKTPRRSMSEVQRPPSSSPHPPQRRYPTVFSFGTKRRPYDRLFEATLLLGPSPVAAGAGAEAAEMTEASGTAAKSTMGAVASAMIEIRDLRTGVPATDAAGRATERAWLEPAECPLCGSAIR